MAVFRISPQDGVDPEEAAAAVAGGQPMFDLGDAAGVMMELTACRREHGGLYIRLMAFDNAKGWESIRMSFILNRPAEEPGFGLVRSEGPGRQLHYTLRGYAAHRPAGERYGPPTEGA
ncbi:MAG: ribulose bisphosphate carboxylase small subunit [Caulobacteraceae bacterium]|nr:ribulose bisphosphate carboxylase small subunit [Caulobacteraceae bacterium]